MPSAGLVPESAALVVLDAQKIYTDPKSELYCEDNDATIGRINRLIDLFPGDRVVLVRHVHKRDGSDLGRMFDVAGPFEDFNFKEGSDEVAYDQRLRRPAGAYEIVKARYSAFRGTDLKKFLESKHITHLVICGFMTNFCCDATAKDAHDRDYYVTFITEATGCPALPDMSETEIRKVVSALLEGGFATLRTVDEVSAGAL